VNSELSAIIRHLKLDLAGHNAAFLWGPRQVGKTTLLKHLLGVLVPKNGSVRVFGLDPGKEYSKIRERIGVVMQDVDEQILGPTVYDDILFAPLNYGVEKKKAEALAKEGLDYIHASTGRFESMKYTLPKEEGALLPEAAAIKKVVDIPVICPNIHTPETGEQALKQGLVDAISLSRGLIADPEWPNKALNGREEEITACVRCNSCLKGAIGGLWRTLHREPGGWQRAFYRQVCTSASGYKITKNA